MALKTAITVAISCSAILASSATIDERVVKGESVGDREIKFMTSILRNGRHICGGSLLDNTTVVTAAHCVDKFKNLSVRTRGAGGTVVQVASSVMHPDYDGGLDENGLLRPGPKYHNDIAIVKLADPVQQSSDIDYATLPPAGSDAAVNSIATAAGWGSITVYHAETSPKGRFPLRLQKAVLRIRPRADCTRFENIGERDTIICAVGGGSNVCSQDSGGPLFDAKTGQLLGLVSQSTEDEQTGESCGRTPGVFTRVGSYIDFITSHLGA